MDKISMDDRETFLREADDCLAQGSFPQAMALARDRLALYPGDSEALIIIAQACLGMDNLEEGAAALVELDAMFLRLARLYKAMGEACLKRDLKWEANAYLQKGKMLLPEVLDAYPLSQEMTDLLTAINDEGLAGGSVAEDEPAVSPDFYTVTMADLYIRQGHPDQAIEILEAIAKREPHNTSVAERLRTLKGQEDKPSGGEVSEGAKAVISELIRWLNNIDRIRSHDGQAHQNA